MNESIWTRQRAAAPGRETLSLDQIVQTAMALLDEEGVAGLSMRKLAAKLGAGATSLYWHVPTKNDLVDLLIDEVWGEIDVPQPELAGWRAGALLFAHSLRSAVLRHPWLPEVMYTRPSVGPKAMSLGARGLTLFGAAGFSGNEGDRAMSCVMSYVLGTVSAEVASREMVRKSGQSESDWMDQLRQETLAVADQYPEMQKSVHRRLEQGFETNLNENFAYGLDVMLDGLQTRIKQ
ncbi:TetR/AcrR family transcriptional regulator C-terminal domain-containing protein [Kribbella sp. NPDC026611]|uniref:TetR/AcrR family transcriptional regulator C-terminal domain-containing protein n=1 Tax=Kribbella sp. NPDC026611 TaxID=3154911 RepID=UPI0033DD49A5